MGAELVVLIAFLLLLLLLALEVPVGHALATSGAFGLLVIEGPGITDAILGREAFSTLASFSLVIVPMFVLMGMLAQRGRIATDAFALAARWTRRVPGGLAVGAVLACAGFAAISGSSLATVASVGRIAIREMRRFGYDLRFAAGVVSAAGTLGVLIPPSVVLVLYGIATGESIGRLLIAGIIPGALSALLYIGAIVIRAHRHPELAPRPNDVWSDVVIDPEQSLAAAAEADLPRQGSNTGAVAPQATTANSVTLGRARERPAFPVWGLVQIALLFVVVIGGIYSGYFTSTEAAAVGALLALVLLLSDVLTKNTLETMRNVMRAFKDAVEVSTMALWLVVGATIFTTLVVVGGLPAALAGWVVELNMPPVVIVLIILSIFVPLGMILDPISIILIAVPITYPAVTALGFSGVWYGVLVVKMIELGLVTPPVGLNIFVVAGTTPELTVEDTFQGILWFIPVDLITVGALVLFPGLVTWLPNLM